MRHLLLSSCIAILTFALHARADAPLTMADVKDKPGESTVKLTGRSPLSDPKVIFKRIGATADAKHPIPNPFDFSAEDIYVYVPSHPAEDGKFGLLIGACVTSHQFAPQGWHDVLEKKHLVWVGTQVYSQSFSHLRSMALVLDATDNATKTWPIDPRRVYLDATRPNGPVAVMPMFYPEVYDGLIAWCVPAWYAKLTNARNGEFFPATVFVPPTEQLSKAKTNCRFVIAYPANSGANTECSELGFQAYKAAGFKNVKAIPTDAGKISDYSQSDGQWFEQSIEFLDSSESESAPTTSKPALVAHPAESSAAAAQSALTMAQNYIAARRYDAARKYLQKILDQYPTQPAATEAKKLMKDIEGK